MRFNFNSRASTIIIGVRVLNDTNQIVGVFDLGQSITVEIEYRVNSKLHGLQLAMTISRNMVDIIHTFDTDTLGPVEWVLPGLYRLRHQIPPMFLKAGSYSISLTIGTPTTLIQELNSVVQFDVERILLIL